MKKDRYELKHYEQLIDVYDNKLNTKRVMGVKEIFDLLNEQDARIKELENMNSRLSQGIYWGNGEHFCDVVKKLKQENQQLKQSQNQKAIEELDKIIILFEPYENDCKDTILCANSGISFIEYIENHIKDLIGIKNK